MKKTYKNNGFSLIEISVVLVIIGFITAAISAGTILIEEYKIRATVTDLRKYEAAAVTFKDLYDALPGDITNAQTIWPSCTDSGSNTCNGNGDGRVSLIYEGVRAWQHMNLAGVLEGSYTGVGTDGASGYETIGGVNAPKARIGNNGASFINEIGPAWGTPQAKMGVITGSFSSGNASIGPLFSPEQAANIDEIIDGEQDAQKGKLRTYPGSGASNCVSGSTYQLTYTGARCRVAYHLPFGSY